MELATWRVTAYFGTSQEPHRPTVAISDQAVIDDPQFLVQQLADTHAAQHGPLLSFMCANLDAMVTNRA